MNYFFLNNKLNIDTDTKEKNAKNERMGGRKVKTKRNYRKKSVLNTRIHNKQ